LCVLHDSKGKIEEMMDSRSRSSSRASPLRSQNYDSYDSSQEDLRSSKGRFTKAGPLHIDVVEDEKQPFLDETDSEKDKERSSQESSNFSNQPPQERQNKIVVISTVIFYLLSALVVSVLEE
jgi:hypothetical protein